MCKVKNMNKQELKIKTFDDLTTHELYEIVRARCDIFLLEQGIVCEDFDRIDYNSLHCFIYEDGEVKAYLRAFLKDGEIKVGRVLSRVHKMGLGRRLLEEALPRILSHFGKNEIHVDAQSHAVGFYERMGFVVTSEEFLEEGIPHKAMLYTKG